MNESYDDLRRRQILEQVPCRTVLDLQHDLDLQDGVRMADVVAVHDQTGDDWLAHGLESLNRAAEQGWTSLIVVRFSVDTRGDSLNLLTAAVRLFKNVERADFEIARTRGRASLRPVRMPDEEAVQDWIERLAEART